MLAKLIMSALYGLLYGGLGALAFWVFDVPDIPRMSLIIFLTAFGACLLMTQLLEDRMYRRFKQAESRLPANPQAAIPVSIREGRKLSSSRAYLYEGEILLLNVTRREPRIDRVLLGRVKHAAHRPPMELLLELVDGRTWLLLSADIDVLLQHLQAMGCQVEEIAR